MVVRSKENALIEYIDKTTKKMVEIARAKNRDYAGEGADDPFKNFTVVEDLGVATVEQGLLTRMADKYMRIVNLTKQEASVKDESIHDTLLDLATYSLILSAYLSMKAKS